MENKDTEQQFKDVMAECRSLFAKKLHEYLDHRRLPTSYSSKQSVFALWR